MIESPRADSLPMLRPVPVLRSPGRSISSMFHEMLKGLASLELPKAQARDKRTVRRYRDAEFNYVEAVVPGLEGIEADICIHNGQVYVRIAR